MPKYMISYVGTPDHGDAQTQQRQRQAYMKWLSDLGEAAISPMNPLKNTVVMQPDRSRLETSRTTMSGFTIIEAESDQKAYELIQACPYLDSGGELEISEMIEMPG